MPNLENRISALERVTCPDNAITIIRRIVTTGHLNAEVDHICDHDGNEWVRRPRETEDQFINRADRETIRKEWGCKRLTAKSVERQFK